MKKSTSILLTILLIILLIMIPTFTFASTGEVGDSQFFTWGMLATYAGCLAATLLVTQFVKPLWPQRWATQFLSYMVAVLILILANLFIGSLTPQSAVISILNAIVIALAANGGYSNIKQIVDSKNKIPDE